MKQRLGTSKHFVVTAVIFEDEEEADSCERKIVQCRIALGLRPGFEFHFNSCSDSFRQAFLKTACSAGFFYYSLVLNKGALWSQGFNDSDSLYKYTTSLVFENAKPLLRNASVIIDKCGDRQFREQLAKYLKRKMNEPGNTLIKKVKMEASHSNNLLQLADMVCGAVARSYKMGTTSEGWVFRKLIRHREGRVQLWPK